MLQSPPIPRPVEVEEQVQDAALKRALEAALVAVAPLLVDDPERNVLVGRACDEADHARRVVHTVGVLLDLVRGRLGLVDEVVVQDVELVALPKTRTRARVRA